MPRESVRFAFRARRDAPADHHEEPGEIFQFHGKGTSGDPPQHAPQALGPIRRGDRVSPDFSMAAIGFHGTLKS